MRKSLKIFVYLLIMMNLSSVFMGLQNVNARLIGTYQNSLQNENFGYNIDTPLVNGSNANRIAVENFEYATNTNLSTIERYRDIRFSCIVKDFNDIDVGYTNNIYKSKLCEITKLNSGLHDYKFVYNLSNDDLRLSYTYFRSIHKPLDCSYQYFRYNYSLSSYFVYMLDYLTGDLTVLNNGVTVKLKTDFIPLKTTFEFIYVESYSILVFTNYTIGFKVKCYNSTGIIIQTNSTQIDLEPYKNILVNNFVFGYGLSGSGKKTDVRALDTNFITDRRLYTQNSIRSDDFQANDLLTFYLTKVPFYTTDLISTNNEYRYATTIFKSRYLRYLTNVSYNYNNEYNFSSNYQNSFSMKIGFALNDSLSLFEFHSTYFYFNESSIILDFYNKSIVIYLYEGLTLIRQTIYDYSQNFMDNFTVIHAQFKNNLFSLTFLYNFTQITELFYINKNFDKVILFGYITNFELKTVTDTSIMNYQNQTITVLNDLLSFRNKISFIESRFEFFDLISITKIGFAEITVNNVEFQIYKEYIIDITVNVTRNVASGYFDLTFDNEHFYSLFKNSTQLMNSESLLTIMYGKEEGNLILHALFYQSSSNDIKLQLNFNITRLLVFTDHIPENNLLIAKILEILIPLMIFFLIVIAFKSNSDSKFLPLVGMYIGIFTLYLMEYMSLLFMILCFIFQTLGLYIVIKHEKSEGV